MAKFNSIRTDRKDEVLAELRKEMLTPPPFEVSLFPSNDYIKDYIVEYMLDRIKKYYNVETNHEALSLWDRYKSEVLEHE